MSNTASAFGLDPGSSKDERKQALMQTIHHETNVENARMLIEKINEKCFEKCVPKPGSSLSAAETTCLTNCLQKYMAAWNAVSAAYIARIKTDPAL